MSDMQPRPPFDRVLLILIAVGVVLILGIGWALGSGDPGQSPASPTASPSGIDSLAVETLTRSPSTPFAKDDSIFTPTGTDPGPSAETPAATGTWTAEILPTPSATFTPGGIQPLQSGQYDDTDPNIAYDSHWIALKNPSTLSSYKGTIHASYDSGSEAFFRFTGKQVRLGYKRGKSFGTVKVLIDDQSYGFHEQAFDLVWRSPQMPPGDHFVRIIHESGESINLDYILIID